MRDAAIHMASILERQAILLRQAGFHDDAARMAREVRQYRLLAALESDDA